jgi:hypothetical protein
MCIICFAGTSYIVTHSLKFKLVFTADGKQLREEPWCFPLDYSSPMGFTSNFSQKLDSQLQYLCASKDLQYYCLVTCYMANNRVTKMILLSKPFIV